MEISEFLENNEKENVEFKASLSEKNKILKTISAFSNKRGGTILVGINDNRDVVGVDIGRNTLENLANNIRRERDPPVYPYIDYSDINGKTVLIIEVSESVAKPVFYRNRTYIRVGRTNQRLSSTEIRNFISNESRITSWDEQVIEEVNFEEIDNKKVSNFLKLASIKRNLDMNPETPKEESLKRLELTKDGKLTNAAIILFGLNPQKYVLQAITQCAKFKGIDTNEFDDMHDFEGTIIDQIDNAMRFAEKYYKRSAKIEGSDRIEEFDYPVEAIREAITNAICHRDYRINSNVQLRIFEDRMEVWGCGPLPKPLTVEDLSKPHESIRRNPLVAKCFYQIGLIEKWGTGTQRIISSCLENGLPEPLFEIKSGSLVVTIRKYKFTQNMKIELNERQLKAMEYIIKNGSISIKEYLKLIPEKSRGTLKRDLSDLVERKLVKPVGPQKTRRYEAT